MNTDDVQVLDLPLHSRLRQRVAAAPMAVAPGPAWAAWLQAQLRNGLSGQELAASGLDAWLVTQPQRLAREDVLARLACLPTDVEVWLPKRQTPAPLVFEPLERRCPEFEGLLRMLGLVDPCPVLDSRNAAYGFQLARWHVYDLLLLQPLWRVLDARGRPWRTRHLGGLESPWFMSREAAVEWCETIAARLAPGRRAGRPPVVRFSRYRLRAGSDYREWLLVLPHFRFDRRFKADLHFDTHQLLMHLRTCAPAHLRTSVQGRGDERFLFTEEIQSDYNQAISQCERRRDVRIEDNAYQANWVELGLRVALLIAARQGLAGVAVANGVLHDLIYRSANAGRAAFYDERVARALHKLARALGLASGTTSIIGRTQHCLVVPVYAPVAEGGERRYWRIGGRGQTADEHLCFPSREQAERYAKACLEEEVTLTVPVLWLDEPARRRLLSAGLPVLGAVERLAGEVVA